MKDGMGTPINIFPKHSPFLSDKSSEHIEPLPSSNLASAKLDGENQTFVYNLEKAYSSTGITVDTAYSPDAMYHFEICECCDSDRTILQISEQAVYTNSFVLQCMQFVSPAF